MSVTRTFIHGSAGAWETAANWNPIGVPASGDLVDLNGQQVTQTSGALAQLVNLIDSVGGGCLILNNSMGAYIRGWTINATIRPLRNVYLSDYSGTHCVIGAMGSLVADVLDYVTYVGMGNATTLYVDGLLQCASGGIFQVGGLGYSASIQVRSGGRLFVGDGSGGGELDIADYGLVNVQAGGRLWVQSDGSAYAGVDSGYSQNGELAISGTFDQNGLFSQGFYDGESAGSPGPAYGTFSVNSGGIWNCNGRTEINPIAPNGSSQIPTFDALSQITMWGYAVRPLPSAADIRRGKTVLGVTGTLIPGLPARTQPRFIGI